MKVYVVWSGGDDHGFYGNVLGVYSTKEKAEESIEGTYTNDANIEEFEIDA